MTSPHLGEGGSPTKSKTACIQEGVHNFLIFLDVLCEWSLESVSSSSSSELVWPDTETEIEND